MVPILALLLAFSHSSAAASSPTFSAYFANWAQYHLNQYKHVADSIAPIAGRTDNVLFSFLCK